MRLCCCQGKADREPQHVLRTKRERLALVTLLLVLPLYTGACATSAPVPSTTPAAPGCLVYADQGADQPLWLVRGTSTPQVLAQGSGPQISPDGRSVTYIRGFPEQLRIAKSDGTGDKLLYTAPMGSPLIGSTLWSPSGTMIAFGLTCPGCPASQNPGALWRLDVSTGAVRQLLAEGAHWPLFSPDGHWLAVASPLGTLVSHGSVGLIDVEGQGNPALFDFVEVRGRAWAGDSSGFMVAFQASTSDPATTDLWWLPIEGDAELLGRLANVTELSWQPGGGRLVYRMSAGDGRLYLAERDGSQKVPIPGSDGLSPLPGQLPAWSPDGRWLLAVDDHGAFYMVDTSGPSVHRLDVQLAYGWLDASQYLASYIGAHDLERYNQGEGIALDLVRCAPLGRCDPWTTVPRSAVLSYAKCP